jgi:dipeptidyl aminopeptidase/acylaminoacyl peptidase
MRNCFLLVVFALYSYNLFAQVPTTDIYLLDMKVKKGKYSFSNPIKINDWHGYNNQPYFTPDGNSIYYVSYREKQSDIYKYDIDSKKTSQFTNTPEDEYSPKLTPDGKNISVVRVMKDSAQQLWEFPLDGGKAVKDYHFASDSVAYYTWGEDGGMVFFAYAVVPEPMKVRAVYINNIDTLSDNKYVVDTVLGFNTGRSLQFWKSKNTSSILFVQKSSQKNDSIYWIKSIPNTHSHLKIKNIVQTLPNSEDFALGPKNTLFMGHLGKLYKYQISKDKEWIEIADFSGSPYKNFYRLAINEKGDKIAIVAYEGKKP